MRDKVVKFENKMTYVFQIIGGVFIVIGTVLVFISAAARYMMGISLEWAEETCRMLILACSFWLMGHMEFSNGQVYLSILVDGIKNEKVLKIIHFVKYCIVTVISMLCLYWGTLQFMESKGQKTFTQIFPKQLPASILPIGMAILLIYCVMKIYLMLTETEGHKDAAGNAEDASISEYDSHVKQ